MRDSRVVASSGSDGVPGEIFTGDTARMNRDKLMNLKVMAAAADDGIPREMLGGETMRIDQRSLDGLLEKSEGIAVGTPRLGLPQFVEEPEIEVVAESAADPEVAVEAAPIEVIAREPSMPVMRQSRLRDVLIGGGLSVLVMAAWYCATQL